MIFVVKNRGHGDTVQVSLIPEHRKMILMTIFGAFVGMTMYGAETFYRLNKKDRTPNK